MTALALALALQASTPDVKPFAGWPDSKPVVAEAGERHLRNIRQLTFGGQNAEAYWNEEGTMLTFQSLQPGYPDEQIFAMNADGSGKHLVSTGLGRCTCSYFSPDGRSIYFSSTHARNAGPQAPIDKSKGYVWKVNPDFELYRTPVGAVGNPKPTKVLSENGYVAETTIDPKGRYMVFTSDFEDDLEIYRSKLDGTDLRRLTNHVGYDGGPFVSWDGSKIAYRRDTLDSPAAIVDYKALLSEHLVRPSKLEIFVMDADGKNNRQVTSLGAASFAPFLSPDNKRVIFSSNVGDPKGREFDILMCDLDGENQERVTTAEGFDGFPMWTKDGKRLIFASNRHGSVPGETNLFVADWVE